MRLWSLHPKYLDSKGLVALWRESLLAKAVLTGQTSGYKNHPQLLRFKENKNTIRAINFYLQYVFEEAKIRGYNFDASKFSQTDKDLFITVNDKQLEYEFQHLQKKLKARNHQKYRDNLSENKIIPHKIFRLKSGDIEYWEIL